MSRLVAADREKMGPHAVLEPSGAVDPLVIVAEVLVDGPASGLLGCSIDSPRAGGQSDAHLLEVSGWALGASAPVAAVEVLNQGQIIRSVPLAVGRPDVAETFQAVPYAAVCGFSVVVGTVQLETDFELLLLARMSDGSAQRIGAIRGRTADLATKFPPMLQPLLVTFLGRTGSTALMHLLAQAPGIACATTYPYELRVAQYWAHMLGVLCEPPDHRNSANPDTFQGSLHWVGSNPYAAHPALSGWAATEYVAGEAAHVQGLIDVTYGRIAAAMDRFGTARYFAEKAVPSRQTWLMRRLYPGMREIFLVRDFRDVFCSVMAFNAKRGYKSFGMEQVNSEADYFLRLRAEAESLRNAWRRRSAESLLVRYEDLMLDPVGVAQRILTYLELPASEEDAGAMVASASVEDPALRNHRTTGSGAESVGRWRRDMPSELWEECAAALDDVLLDFGYEPTLECEPEAPAN